MYRAWDHQMRADRAIKVMLPDAARRKKLRARFEREAHTLARLEHPNLVRVYDVANQSGVPFLVMELITGGTLMDWVERNGAMPPRMAVQAILQLCEGVAAAHDANIVHRDIKPHNVLISRSGVCKLADFGIAHVEEDSLTRTGSAMGTIGYMPPEQRKDAKSVDVRCDVFSVAATLWFLLKAEPVLDLFLAADEPELLSGIPEVLHPVLIEALAYNRRDRTPDIRTFRDALAATVEALPPDRPCPELAAPEPTVPELEADWFDELAPLFDEDFRGTPTPTELRAPVSAPMPAKALPYFMPGAPKPDPPRNPAPPLRARRADDSLPDYIDREALSQGDRSHDILAPEPEKPKPPEPEPPSGLPLALGGSALTASLIGVVLVSLLVLSSFAYTGFRLGQTATATEKAEERYYQLLDTESIVINDLVGLGVPRTALDEHYFAYQDAKDEASRARAAEALVDALDKASASLDPEGNPKAAAAQARIDQLIRMRQLHASAEAAWEGYATSIRGRMLRGLGIGTR